MDIQFSVAPGDVGLAFSSSGELFVGNQSDASNGGGIYGYTFDNSGNPTLASYLPVSGFHITGVAIGASVHPFQAVMGHASSSFFGGPLLVRMT